MFIAVCDDDVQARRQISDILDAYAGTCRQLLHYQLFENAEDMLRAAGTERFTHYFLDVMMPGMDRMAAAKEIRAFDPDAKLVFLTSFSEYAYQSYRVLLYGFYKRYLYRTHGMALSLAGRDGSLPIRPRARRPVQSSIRSWKRQKPSGHRGLRASLLIPFSSLSCSTRHIHPRTR